MSTTGAWQSERFVTGVAPSFSSLTLTVSAVVLYGVVLVAALSPLVCPRQSAQLIPCRRVLAWY